MRNRLKLLVGAGLLLGLAVTDLEAQVTQEIIIPVGNSSIVTTSATVTRIMVGDENIADPVPVSATEVVIRALQPGSTTLLVWDVAGTRSSYTIRVTIDAQSIQRELEQLFPGEPIEVSAVGGTLILSGTVRNPLVAEKALTLAQTLTSADIIDNLIVPDPGQVLLQVRFAEVGRSWLEEIGPELVARAGDNVVSALGTGRTITPVDGQTISDAEAGPDAVNFFIFHDPSRLTAYINALQNRGIFRSLAEPNVLAMPAESASFLAGGEFPFPVLQGGGNQAVTIQFKEFGVRLNFVPFITNSGAIRLQVAPEVSSLDFANGLQISGFNIPALLSRKVATVIELEDGQTFAIAGLLDNSITESINKIPLLGDIPILGELFKSREMRQNRSELLVLVTPRIVQPLDQMPTIPTGEPDTWNWNGEMRGERGPEGSDGMDPS